jgi:hypothetical protein
MNAPIVEWKEGKLCLFLFNQIWVKLSEAPASDAKIVPHAHMDVRELAFDVSHPVTPV